MDFVPCASADTEENGGRQTLAVMKHYERPNTLLPRSNTLEKHGYIEGRLIRKKRRHEVYQLAMKESPQQLCEDLWVPVDHCRKLFLESVIRISECHSAVDDDGKTKWIGVSIDLVTCAANPIATKWLLDNDALGMDYLKSVLLPPLAPASTMEKLEQLLLNDEPIAPYQNAWIVRTLAGREKLGGRNKPPKIARKEVTALETLEASVKLYPIQFRAVPEVTLCLPVHLSDDDEQSRRLQYLKRKKHPQVSWFVQRLHLLLSSVSTNSKYDSLPRRIVDVGGGRGDLARAIAIAFPLSQVTVVDSNESSLEAGRKWCSDVSNMSFLKADFTTIPPDPEVDLVVALHACGGLSDLALQYANACQADFCICPCCYTKMDPGGMCNGLHRLAELNEGPQVLPRRARLMINSNRLRQLEANYESVVLEEFNEECSRRNIVLVGKRRA